LDELGFTPLNRVIADHIFRIVSERNERGSIIIVNDGRKLTHPWLGSTV
jgi:hypothetical protein